MVVWLGALPEPGNFGAFPPNDPHNPTINTLIFVQYLARCKAWACKRYVDSPTLVNDSTHCFNVRDELQKLQT
jgi:hypothetical protein